MKLAMSLFSIITTPTTLRMIIIQISVTKNFTFRTELCNKIGQKYRKLIKTLIRNGVGEITKYAQFYWHAE